MSILRQHLLQVEFKKQNNNLSKTAEKFFIPRSKQFGNRTLIKKYNSKKLNNKKFSVNSERTQIEFPSRLYSFQCQKQSQILLKKARSYVQIVKKINLNFESEKSTLNQNEFQDDKLKHISPYFKRIIQTKKMQNQQVIVKNISLYKRQLKTQKGRSSNLSYRSNRFYKKNLAKVSQKNGYEGHSLLSSTKKVKNKSSYDDLIIVKKYGQKNLALSQQKPLQYTQNQKQISQKKYKKQLTNLQQKLKENNIIAINHLQGWSARQQYDIISLTDYLKKKPKKINLKRKMNKSKFVQKIIQNAGFIQ